MIWSFGDYRLDDSDRQLLRGSTGVPLTAKAFDVLRLLVANHARTVTKEEFMDLAVVEIQHARDLTPDWFITTNDALFVLVHARRYDEAIRECTKAVQLDPRRNTAWAILGAAYAATGNYDAAIGPLERAVAGANASRARHMATLAWTHAKAGRREKALELIEVMKGDRHPWVAYSVARAYTATGDRDAVFAWLNRAADEKFAFLFYIRIAYEFDGIREDPRYAQLLARLNLTP